MSSQSYARSASPRGGILPLKCQVPDCSLNVEARGYCKNHYRRFMRVMAGPYGRPRKQKVDERDARCVMRLNGGRVSKLMPSEEIRLRLDLDYLDKRNMLDWLARFRMKEVTVYRYLNGGTSGVPHTLDAMRDFVIEYGLDNQLLIEIEYARKHQVKRDGKKRKLKPRKKKRARGAD